MSDAIKASLSGTGANWAVLQQEWMCRLAARADCAEWGYKMPQAFRYLDQLFQLYPDLRVIFLMRAPQDVLASYKHMRPESEDGDPAQYHPIAHAIYWRLAAQAYLETSERFKDRVMLMKFGDLVSDPAQAADTIASFLRARKPKSIQTPQQANTSFASAGGRKTLNGLELFLLERIAGRMRDRLGFEANRQKILPRDFADLLLTSLNFTGFRIKKLFLTKFQKQRT